MSLFFHLQAPAFKLDFCFMEIHQKIPVFIPFSFLLVFVKKKKKKKSLIKHIQNGRYINVSIQRLVFTGEPWASCGN